MKFGSLALALFLTAVFPMRAMSVFIDVTPARLDAGQFVFDIVVAEPKDDEVSFTINISGKKNAEAFPPSAALAICEETKTKTGAIDVTLNAVRKVELTHAGTSFSARFAVTREELLTPGFCFAFSEVASTTLNGKRIPMPSADTYKVHLREFVKSP